MKATVAVVTLLIAGLCFAGFGAKSAGSSVIQKHVAEQKQLLDNI